MVLPGIQKEYPFVKVKSLDGDFILAKKPEFSWSDWYSGTFQTAFDRYLEDHIGFRDFFVRMTNQIDYSFYRTPHADGVVIGKEDQLYEFDYIREYTGGDFIGAENIDRKIRKLKFLQKYLKEEKNIDLVLVFEPGKASILPEFIPDHYFEDQLPYRNYDWLLKKTKEYNVTFIDFDAYFKTLKGKTDFQLYPRYGIHWSIYGMTWAADSLVSYIEDLRQIDMPDVYLDSLQIEHKARRPDYDVGLTLNLLWRLPEKEPLAYPVYNFENNPEKDKPMVLSVADSYYWNIYNTRIPSNLFKNEAFWYFYAKVYPDSYHQTTHVNDLNIKKEIEKQEVIFLMVTGRFLHKFGWNFIEDAYRLYGPVSEYDKLHKFKCDIWNYSEWFNDVIEKARTRGITLEEMLQIESEYVYSQENISGLLSLMGPAYFERQIRKDRSWFKLVKEKAEEKNISMDDAIAEDANYILKTDYPESYKTYHLLDSIKQSILNDSILVSENKQLANYYYLTLEEMLQIKAEEKLRLIK